MADALSSSATPRPAATLILLRREGPEMRLLMGRRPASMAFMPNVWVFPGGALEDQDAAEGSAEGALGAACRAALMRKVEDGAAPEALAACALREAAEETGLAIRRRRDLLRFGFRAITPPRYKRRYDARFFLGRVEAVVASDPDAFHRADDELEALSWITLAEARGLKAALITEYILRELDALLAAHGAEALLADPPPFTPTLFRGAYDGATIEPLGPDDACGGRPFGVVE